MGQIGCDEFGADDGKESAESRFCFSEAAARKDARQAVEAAAASAAWAAARRWWCDEDCPRRQVTVTLGRPRKTGCQAKLRQRPGQLPENGFVCTAECDWQVRVECAEKEAPELPPASHAPQVEDQDLMCSESAEARGSVSTLGIQATGGTLFGLITVTDDVAKVLAAAHAWHDAMAALRTALLTAAANAHCPASCPRKVLLYEIQPSIDGPAVKNAKGEWEWGVVADWTMTVSCAEP